MWKRCGIRGLRFFSVFFFSTLLGGIHWSPIEEISKGDVEDLNVTQDINGGIHAVWLRGEYGESLGEYFQRKEAEYLEICSKVSQEKWGTPETVSNLDLSSFSNAFRKVSIASDNQDNIHVFLSGKTKQLNSEIYTKEKFAFGEWSDWKAFSSQLCKDVIAPLTTADHIGTLYACWQESGQMEYLKKIQVSEKRIGEKWSNPISLTTSLSSYEDHPRIKSDNMGNTYCVWEHKEYGGIYTIKCAEKPFGGQWLGPIDISLNKGYLYNSKISGWFPKISIGPEDDVFVVWNEKERGNKVYVSYRISQNNWSSAQLISDKSTSCLVKTILDVQVDRMGNAIVVWLQTDDVKSFSNSFNFFSRPSRERTLQAAIFSNGFGWSKPSTITSVESRGCDLRLQVGFNIDIEKDNISYPSLAMDREGNALLVWILGLGNKSVIQASTRICDDSWSEPVDISSFDTASKSNVKVVADNQGFFHIIWLEGSWRRGQVKVRSGQY